MLQNFCFLFPLSCSTALRVNKTFRNRSFVQQHGGVLVVVGSTKQPGRRKRIPKRMSHGNNSYQRQKGCRQRRALKYLGSSLTSRPTQSGFGKC